MENLIIRAARFARDAHAGQVRKYTNTPYIEHPMRVAGRVMLIDGATETMVAAAFLHDTVEDTRVSSHDLLIAFGPAVQQLVYELTNPSKYRPELSRTKRKRMDREHLATVSWEANCIKAIDRIDNLKEMFGASPDFRKLYAGESLLLANAISDGIPGWLYEELVDAAHALWQESTPVSAIE